jgi:hypothetical protein
VLRIRREDGAQGSVWFRDGDVFFAQSNWRTEPLGERLVRAQRITPMALERALELRALEPAEGGKRLGEILVEGGFITDKVLEAFVQEQMQDTVFDLMRWDDGDFEFEAMPEVLDEDIGMAVSIENVIMEGSRRLDEWVRIKKKIPSTDIVFKMATAPGEGTFEISLKPIEWNLLLLVDGSRSVSELAVITNRTDFEVARIIYGLFSAGLLEFASDDEVVRLREEREAREAKAAELEEQRAAAHPQAEPLAEEIEAPPVEPVERTPSAKKKAAPAVKATEAAEPPTLQAQPVETEAPAEVPEFLGAKPQEATAEDLAALEAAMGAVLDHAAPHETPPAEEAAPKYTPGEEPAFIAASQAQLADEGPAPSVEELLGDIAELAPPAEEPVLEPESEPQPEPEAGSAPEPVPELVLEPEPIPEQEQEAPPIPVQEAAPPVEPEPEPEPEPVPAPEAVHEIAPELLSVAEALEEAPVAPEEEPPLEPGTFVIVPAAEPSTEAGEGEEAVIEVEPLSYVVPEVVSPEAPMPSDEQPSPVAAQATGAVPGLAGFEQDLMSLGLGELPPEFAEAAPAEAATEVELGSGEGMVEEIALEAVVEPMGVAYGAQEVPEAQPTTEPEEAALEHADFSDLLESLDISADDQEAAGGPAGPSSGTASELLIEEPAEASAGVISTDAFLDDLTLDKDLGFSGELTDELSALTGASRPARPSASVRHLPAEGEAPIRRDTRVDRETLMKIIDGIKGL